MLLLLWLSLARADAPVAAGAALATVSYGNTALFTTAMVAASAHPASARRPRQYLPLYVPVVGPALYLSRTPASAGTRRLLIADTVLQAAGAMLLTHAVLRRAPAQWSVVPSWQGAPMLVLSGRLDGSPPRLRGSTSIHQP